MDKDEQAPSTPPETPEVEKTEPAEAAPEIKITDEPKVKTTEAPVEEKKDVAAEMDKLLNDEAAAPTPAPQPMMGKKHNHVGIIILLSILVLLSVGFAIFVYFTAGQGKECDCPKCETPECNCEKEEEEEEVSSKDYIYISEWGIKIKKPENWSDSFIYYSYYNVDRGGNFVIAETEVDNMTEDNPNLSKVGLTLFLDEDCVESDNTICINSDDITGLSVQYDSEVSDSLINHFSNVENYSKI